MGVDGADECGDGLDIEVDGPVECRDVRRKGCFRHGHGYSRGQLERRSGERGPSSGQHQGLGAGRR